MVEPVRIGFVGGGQLAMMTAQEALRLNDERDGHFSIKILDPTRNCPASPFVDDQIVADFKDPNALNRLAAISDILTYEIELGNAEALIDLQEQGAKIFPSPQTLKVIQDKLTQKTFLKAKGIPVADYASVSFEDELFGLSEEFGFPLMLKDRFDAYDGRGNYLCSNLDELEHFFKILNERGRNLMIERFVDFEKEVSVITARGMDGRIATYPVGENVHKQNILEMTVMPARISDSLSDKATVVARKVADAFGDVGVFGIEMFVANGSVLVNEVAPRVHNTGHGTLEKEAFTTSQFEQHLLAISGSSLGDTKIKAPVVMHNILGDDNFSGPYEILGQEDITMIPGAHLHLYGKQEVRPRRKMGHVSVVGKAENFTYNDERISRIHVRSDENPDLVFDEASLPTLIERAKQARSLLKFVPARRS